MIILDIQNKDIKYSFIEFKQDKFNLVASGSIQTDKKAEHSKRLLELKNDIDFLIKKYNPDFDATNMDTWAMTPDEYNKISSMEGLIMSWYDAPGGFAEEMAEINWGVGLEYAYNEQFFGRLGYNNEAKDKGNRKYFTVGAGFKLSAFKLDVGYVIATSASNPLDQTLRFSLAFDIDGIKALADK